MSDIVLQVHEREVSTKNANRRLRTTGQVPAVVYGGGQDPVPIRVDERKVEEILKSGAGENTVFLLQLHGTDKQRHAMIKELQTDSITGEMIHIDFQRIVMDQKVRVMVPIELHGESTGVKNEGGLVDFVTREIEVECLPGEIPEHFEIDLSPLHIGQHLEAGDLELPQGVELLTEPERVLVSVSLRKKVEIEEELEEEEEMLIEAEAEEPEVISRGKAEGEG